MVTLVISRLRFPSIPLTSPITVSLYVKPYYGGSYTLIESGVTMDVNGNITDSPLPTISIDPTMKYLLKAINENCGAIYEQPVVIYPYCPVGYTLSPDASSCFVIEETDATPPTNSESAVTVSSVNNFNYGVFGSLIYAPGYNVNGTGAFTQISYANQFWVNGTGYPTTPSPSNTQGTMNRAGIWSSTVMGPQTVGFSVCANLPANGTYYVGLGCDDFGQIKIDGTTIVMQDRAALGAFLQANGYPMLNPAGVCFDFFHIYPVALTAGSHVLEIIGNNVSGSTPGAADLACEVYDLTPAQIAAATSYADMGAGLIFSSKDFVGMPIQLGSGGIGYSCPNGFALKFCDSPIVCVKTISTPILY